MSTSSSSWVIKWSSSLAVNLNYKINTIHKGGIILLLAGAAFNIQWLHYEGTSSSSWVYQVELRFHDSVDRDYEITTTTKVVSCYSFFKQDDARDLCVLLIESLLES